MKAVVLSALGMENMALVDRAEPGPGPGEVLVRLRAASLNYRDLVITGGGYGSRQRTADLIPLSDGAGEVVATGEGVTGLAVGDRVVANFFQDWIAGEPSAEHMRGALGGEVDGVLAEFRVFPAHGLVKTPAHLTDAEAAALPCAGLTAWSAVVEQGETAPGDRLLTQGTGGVSLFALQFAKLAGAEVIATSSSDQKLERLRTLGADHVLNYKAEPEWGKAALALTHGRGIDHVVEVGGAGTLQQSLRAVRTGGRISLIGVLAGARHDLTLAWVLTRNIRLQGVTVGSREQFERMLRAMTRARLRPVVDRTFPMADFAAAYEHLRSGRHIGKVVIEI